MGENLSDSKSLSVVSVSTALKILDTQCRSTEMRKYFQVSKTRFHRRFAIVLAQLPKRSSVHVKSHPFSLSASNVDHNDLSWAHRCWCDNFLCCFQYCFSSSTHTPPPRMCMAGTKKKAIKKSQHKFYHTIYLLPRYTKCYSCILGSLS